MLVFFDWDNVFSAEWCEQYFHNGPCYDDNGKMLEQYIWQNGAVDVRFDYIVDS